MGYHSYKKIQLENSSEFKLLKGIYTLMDNWFLDPILGFVMPGLGDIITAAVTIPFIFTSIFKLHSVSLTLSIIYNVLMDTLLGMIPVVGDIFDVFYKSYKITYKQIVGYIEGDPEIIEETQSNALKTCILITVLCILIRLVGLALGSLFSFLKS